MGVLSEVFVGKVLSEVVFDRRGFCPFPRFCQNAYVTTES